MTSFSLKVRQGQSMNISVWRFGQSERESALGTISDDVASNMATMTSQSRFQHVMTSVGNEVKVNLGSRTGNERNFLLEVSCKFRTDFILTKNCSPTP